MRDIARGTLAGVKQMKVQCAHCQTIFPSWVGTFRVKVLHGAEPSTFCNVACYTMWGGERELKQLEENRAPLEILQARRQFWARQLQQARGQLTPVKMDTTPDA